MTRYFFDVYDSEFAASDYVGTHCATMADASHEALKALCQIAEDRPERYLDQGLTVKVRDTTNRVVFTATLSLSTSPHFELGGMRQHEKPDSALTQ